MTPYETPNMECRLVAVGSDPCVLPLPLPVSSPPASCAVIPLYATSSMECRRVVVPAVAAEADAPPAKGAVSPLYDTPSMECRRVVLVAAADDMSADEIIEQRIQKYEQMGSVTYKS